MITVAKIIIEENDQFLLIRRSTNSKFFPERWDFPGGKIHADETPSESAVRETKEETSLNPVIDEIILEGDHTEKGTEIHYCIFSTKEYTGQIKLGEDHSEFAWLSKEQIKDYKTTPFVKAFFDIF